MNNLKVNMSFFIDEDDDMTKCFISSLEYMLLRNNVSNINKDLELKLIVIKKIGNEYQVDIDASSSRCNGLS